MAGRKTFSAIVGAGLKTSSISLRQLCREAKLDASFFSKVLREKLPPPTDEKTLQRIARALQLDPLQVIISTGRIPSELMSAMEDPEVLRRLLQHKDRPASRTESSSRQEPAHRSESSAPTPQYRSPSPHLSEDLL